MMNRQITKIKENEKEGKYLDLAREPKCYGMFW